MISDARTRHRSRHAIRWWLPLLAVTAMSSAAGFVRLTQATAHSDIMAHARLSATFMDNGAVFSYSLWYPLIYVFSGGANSLFWMRFSSIALLTLVVTVKAALVFWYAGCLKITPRAAAGVAVVSVFAMPLLNPWAAHDVYLGQISANVWHNSTNILAGPFALVALWAAVRLVERPDMRRAAVFSGWVVLAALAKPNWPAAFLPVAGIAVLIALWRADSTLRRALPLLVTAFVPVALTLLWQFTSVRGMVIDGAATRGDLRIDPFYVWGLHSEHIVLSMVLSFAGPVIALWALPADRRRATPMVLAWMGLLIGTAQMILFAESGRYAWHANWFWGAYTSLLLVFVVSCLELARSTPSWRVVIAWVVIAGHVITGGFYLAGLVGR